MSRFKNFSFGDHHDLLRNIQLEASAGTGKTYSIERIVALLIAVDSLSLSQILIVTFTKKAARELKERIRLILFDASRSGVLDLGGEPYGLNEGERENIHRAILEFEKASIFTIHSFCLNMLKAYPFESLSQFSMDMESRDDLTGEAVRDYMREIGESMGRGQLIKYKAFLEGGGFEEALEKLCQAVDRELFEPDVRIMPDRDHCDAIIDDIMDFNNKRGDLYQAWGKMVSAIPEKEHLEDLGFGYVGNRIMPGLNKITRIPDSTDFMTICKALSEGNAIATLMKFLPENLEKSLKGKAEPALASADPFVRSAEDFLNLYLYDDDDPKANLYSRALKASFLIEAYDKIQKRLKRKKDITGKLDFNDLIGKLHSNLRRSELVSEIRRRYRTVLIDEFQDTDSRQWDIFSTLFGRDDSHNFFLVGDPKQSIYRFRGADLEIYHKACNSDSVDGRYTLGKNFRSVSSLVKGVNHLFAHIFDPAMHCGHTGRTPFQPVEAGKPDEPCLDDGRASFEFIRLESPAEGENDISDIKESKDLYYRLIAYKAYKLLSGDVLLGDRPVKPGDMAILTESNKECQTLQALLSGYSIPSVINARERIFDTEEAGEFLIFLQALVRMDNSSVKLLLLSRFFSLPPAVVEKLESSGEIDLFTGKLLLWREMVDRGKIIEASRELFDYRDFSPIERSFEERILAERNGERAYSNYRQVLEYLHREQLMGHLDGEELFSLLIEKIKGTSGPDEDLIRLDKDSEAVQIMTMHASKGLEFPIVFFAGALKKDTSSGLQDHYDFVKDSERYYDFLKLKKNQVLQSMDLWEEKKRLYYVALTRASSRLYMPSIKNLGLSYLSSLYSSFAIDSIKSLVTDHKAVSSFSLPLHSGLKLTNHKEKKSLMKALLETIDSSVLKLADDKSGLFSMDRELEAEYLALSHGRDLVYRETSRELELTARQLRGDGSFDERYRKISSYSSIIREAEFAHESKREEADADRDDVKPVVREEPSEDVLTRGAVLGELVHQLFEELDFSLVGKHDFESFASLEEVETLFRDLSVRFFNIRWYGQFAKALKTLIYNTLKNGLGNDFSLCHLDGRDKIHEMEFHMSVEDCEELFVGSDFSGTVEKGFLKGFIDLIFRHDGKYYIADWKTTSSPEGDHYGAYGEEVLHEMMRSHHYKLQSMIYMTALYRYLTVTEGGNFDYDRDFGGCYYFFVRGMSGEVNSDKGIYFHRPDKDELLAFASQFAPLEVNQ